jgi:hypothetical protein
MAGALRFFRYDSDDGTEYGVRLDRSNSTCTVTVGGQPVFPTLQGGAPIGKAAPKGLSLRYANVFSKDNPLIKRKLYIGNIVAYNALAQQANPTITGEDYPGQDDTAGVAQVWIVTSLVGEKRLRIPNSTIASSGGLQN